MDPCTSTPQTQSQEALGLEWAGVFLKTPLAIHAAAGGLVCHWRGLRSPHWYTALALQFPFCIIQIQPPGETIEKSQVLLAGTLNGQNVRLQNLQLICTSYLLSFTVLIYTHPAKGHFLKIRVQTNSS